MSALTPRAFLIALLVMGGVAVFFELGRMDVVSDNEGQRAAPPAEMLRSGSYITPTLNGRVYLAKPPLLYWAIAGVYAITGYINEWTARIPTALCSLGLVLCVYFIFRRRAGEGPARWTALALLASPYFLERSRWAELDVPLSLATFCCIMASYAAWTATSSRRRWTMALLSGIALAAATMLKGPVPYLFLASSFIAFCIMEGGNSISALRTGAKWTIVSFIAGWLLYWPLSMRFPLPVALLAGVWLILALRYGGGALRRAWGPFLLTLLCGVGLVAPWAAAVLSENGWDFIQTLVHSEVIERTHTATRINSGSPFYFIIALPFMLAPWGFLLPLHAAKRQWIEGAPIQRFALLAGWLSVGVFSLIAGKEYEYILPIIPLLLLPTGYHLSDFEQGCIAKWMRPYAEWWARMLVPIMPVGAVGLAIYSVVRYPSIPLFTELTLLAIIVLGAAFWRRGYTPGAALTRIAIGALAIILASLLVRAFHYTGERSPKEIAQLCGRIMDAGHPVEATKIYPAFTFYAAQPITETVDGDAINAKLHGDTPYFYLTRKQFIGMVEGLGTAGGPQIIAGPATNKHLLLTGNTDPKAFLD